MPQARKLVLVRHKIRRGESLLEIAQKYGTTAGDLIRINRLRKAYRPMAGRSLLVPAYVSSVEKQRKQEGVTMLGVVRLAEQRYFMGKSAYTNSFADLDFDPTDTGTGNVAHYTYAAPTVVGGNTYTVTATRNGIDRPIGVGAYTVTINETGDITSTF